MKREIIRVCGFSMAAVWRILPKRDSQGVKPITRAAAINGAILALRSVFSPTFRGGPLIQSLNPACRAFSDELLVV